MVAPAKLEKLATAIATMIGIPEPKCQTLPPRTNALLKQPTENCLFSAAIQTLRDAGTWRTFRRLESSTDW